MSEQDRSGWCQGCIKAEEVIADLHRQLAVAQEALNAERRESNEVIERKVMALQIARQQIDQLLRSARLRAKEQIRQVHQK